MHVFLLLLLLFPIFSESTDNLYGSYRMEEKGLILELTPPANYTLFIADRDKKTGMVTSTELSRGTFAENNRQLILNGQMTDKTMTLSAGDDELLVQEMPGLEKGNTFLRWSGYYESGKMQFEGSWRKGKKHGEWTYFDESGDVQKKELYKRGKLKN